MQRLARRSSEEMTQEQIVQANQMIDDYRVWLYPFRQHIESKDYIVKNDIPASIIGYPGRLPD